MSSLLTHSRFVVRKSFISEAPGLNPDVFGFTLHLHPREDLSERGSTGEFLILISLLWILLHSAAPALILGHNWNKLGQQSFGTGKVHRAGELLLFAASYFCSSPNQLKTFFP